MIHNAMIFILYKGNYAVQYYEKIQKSCRTEAKYDNNGMNPAR